MALTVKSKFIIEDLIDENGKKIGELKFNPNDTRIVNKLMKCLEIAEKGLKEVDSMGEVVDLSNKKINSVEDAKNVAEDIAKINKALSIEDSVFDNLINELEEIFGKETINIFTQGTKDIETIVPILEFVMPYVRKARKTLTDKYNVKNKSGVMK